MRLKKIYIDCNFFDTDALFYNRRSKTDEKREISISSWGTAAERSGWNKRRCIARYRANGIGQRVAGKCHTIQTVSAIHTKIL